MHKIYADEKRIFLDNWNSSYGNKILHLFFLLNLSEKKGRLPVMYKGSNLDNIFSYNNVDIIDINNLKIDSYYYVEKDSFYIQNKLLDKLNLNYRLYDKNRDSVIIKHYKHFLERRTFLMSKLPEKSIKIRGHFFDFDLMPTHNTVLKYLDIRSEHINYVLNKYPNLTSKKSVAVHYRGTDFNNFMRHIFPKGIQADTSYYNNSIRYMEECLGSDITYHLFSDDMSYLENIFKDKKYVIHNDEAYYDWISIYLMNNVIQSSSSFCWTASLFNKCLSTQPKDGYNYHYQTGSVPFGFPQSNSILISNGN